MHIWIPVTFFVRPWFYIRTSLPLARRYIAKHFKGRAGWNDKKIRHVLVLLPHIGGLTGRPLLVFCSVVPFWLFGFGEEAWLTAEVEKEKEAIFLYQTLCECLCMCLLNPSPPPHHHLPLHPLPFTNSHPNSPLAPHTHKCTPKQWDWKKKGVHTASARSIRQANQALSPR